MYEEIPNSFFIGITILILFHFLILHVIIRRVEERFNKFKFIKSISDFFYFS